uniref:Uncharacterized protein n=1 Tax=Tetraselmis sp. GSL018 TaxID=582737 RepID=A0A061R1P3_9CHLO
MSKLPRLTVGPQRRFTRKAKTQPKAQNLPIS